MNTKTQNKLDYLQETKSLIKNALNEKGIAISDSDTFRSYADSIQNADLRSPDVRYVTFMNGEETLYVKPVATGDDCVNVLTKGLITTPKKESTVDKVFTYSGWAATDGGEVDENVLIAITEDKSVYAVYTDSPREYTITYYDSDGTTVLKTDTLAYGVMPDYTPEKDGLNFEGWSPSIAKVTGNASYTATWSEKLSFAGGSWEDIASICEAGEAADYFKVGDTKTIEADGTAVELIVIGMGHDDLADGTGKATLTIMMKGVFADTFTVQNWSTLSTEMISVLKPKLPEKLRSLIKPVVKQCNGAYTSGATPIVDVNFELFPLSLAECKVRTMATYRYSTDSDSWWQKNYPDLGQTYEYFEKNYYSSRYGPYMLTWLTTGACKNSWYRQWSATSNSYGLITTHSFFTSGGGTWSYATTAYKTENHPVLVAFCI